MEPDSPYQAPASDLRQADNPALTITPAGRGSRLVNCMVDLLLIYVLTNIISGLAVLLLPPAFGMFIESLPRLVRWVVVGFVYYTALEYLAGRTLAKMITGTRVVNEHGYRPGFAQVAGRSLCRFIPLEALSFLDKNARGWHDSLPGTYVIQSKLGAE